MSSGTISSMGLGSGTLNGDLIDKLKKADEAKFVKPHEKRLKENETKTSDLNTLKTVANDLKNIAESLSNEINYLDVDAKVNGSAASIVAEAGTRPQDFDLEVLSLATKQIKESGKTFQTDEYGLDMTGTLDFSDIKGIQGTISIELKENMSLKDIKDAIFDKTDGKVIASALNVGTDQFRLVLKSTTTGEDGKFSVIDNSKNADGETNLFGFSETNLQEAKNAEFKLDGVTISRSSNKIDDLIPGVTIELKEEGKISTSITRKTSDTLSKVEKFVEKYNELVSNLNTVTLYDSEKNVRGTFQGNSEMNDIKRTLRSVISNANLDDYGLSILRTGEIALNKEKLSDEINKDFEKVKNFFQGSAENPGFFAGIKNTLFDVTTTNNGLFQIVEDNLKLNNKNLQKELTNAKKNLDNKYDIMTQRFMAFDAMIARMNAGFSSMQMMIQQSIASK